MTRRGLTIVEVLIALGIIGVAFAILSTALVGNLQHTQRAGVRTQATHYLNYLGRRVAGGDAGVLAEVDEPIAWDYGALVTAFPDLPSGAAGRADADRYRAVVENVGTIDFVGALTVHYRVTVCTASATGETCVAGNTLGPEPAVGGTPPPLEGIN